ncbi:MAG: hypothetical protein C4536_15760 [Actinobacteria bacterium]|nr:MAG: hypothetical protein C4536_15760 [Actinomycetota bacterium]
MSPRTARAVPRLLPTIPASSPWPSARDSPASPWTIPWRWPCASFILRPIARSWRQRISTSAWRRARGTNTSCVRCGSWLRTPSSSSTWKTHSRNNALEAGMIALLCATPFELKRLLPTLAGATDLAAPGGMRLVKGTAYGDEVIALATGVGKVAAAAGTRFLLDRHPIEALLVCGIAGALSPDLRLGDLIIATELVPGDVGVAHSGDYSVTGPGLCEEGRVIFHPLFTTSPALVERAQRAAAAEGMAYVLGKVLTCDQIVLDPELRAHLGESFDALAVEMEGAAAAQVAAGEGLPFGAIRTISDELSHDLVGFEKLLQYKGQSRRNLWNKRFRLSVTGRDTITRAKEMAKGRDLALENLASFLAAFLRDTDRPL